MSRIFWTDSDWQTVFRAAQVLLWQHPELTAAELVADAMTHLPADKQRPVVSSNVYSIFNKLKDMGLNGNVENPGQALPPAEKTDFALAKSTPAENRLKAEPEELPAPASTEDRLEALVKGLLVANLAEHKLATLESERRMLEAMDRMHLSLQEMWLGASSEGKSLFSSDIQRLMVASESLQTVRNAALIKHAPQPAYMPQKRRPKVMIFGAMPTQIYHVQDKLPDLEITGTKDVSRVLSGYALVVIMRFCSDQDRHELQKSFPGASIVVNGGVSSVINAIKNHMMMA